ncbi:hypothetical protein KY290_023101 [Solanum tuberosum]|uniref:Uncharacterized protein n=1 Tax=Solanum tuberosum TaxID=4113 RepID=A0ABQ7V8C5_SOLTU|nr:hypothetical protein KY284_022021 [Solanum tuberosum]KAH0684378.1 hypothetical protein KY289_022130 [Solanum tuberosum]KAH0694794.1 hypothetical protein KY285_021891 [Solanum tuberosum]KAH0759608.1 hypothetical protein KY290_023101 [Solanum tuberosum]
MDRVGFYSATNRSKIKVGLDTKVPVAFEDEAGGGGVPTAGCEDSPCSLPPSALGISNWNMWNYYHWSYWFGLDGSKNILYLMLR